MILMNGLQLCELTHKKVKQIKKKTYVKRLRKILVAFVMQY